VARGEPQKPGTCVSPSHTTTQSQGVTCLGKWPTAGSIDEKKRKATARSPARSGRRVFLPRKVSGWLGLAGVARHDPDPHCPRKCCTQHSEDAPEGVSSKPFVCEGSANSPPLHPGGSQNPPLRGLALSHRFFVGVGETGHRAGAVMQPRACVGLYRAGACCSRADVGFGWTPPGSPPSRHPRAPFTTLPVASLSIHICPDVPCKVLNRCAVRVRTACRDPMSGASKAPRGKLWQASDSESSGAEDDVKQDVVTETKKPVTSRWQLESDSGEPPRAPSFSPPPSPQFRSPPHRLTFQLPTVAQYTPG
jgi:hypothetical protein